MAFLLLLDNNSWDTDRKHGGERRVTNVLGQNQTGDTVVAQYTS